jgi:hypothetical protein
MSTSVLYARIPDPLKEALDQEAAKAGTTLTTAIREAIEDGLEARSNKRSIHVLEKELATLRRQLGDARRELQTVKDRESANQRAHAALAKQLERTVGSCPKCDHEVKGDDLLINGACSSCGGGLTDLLMPAGGKGDIDRNEYLFLVGAVGIVLAAAYLSSK